MRKLHRILPAALAGAALLFITASPAPAASKKSEGPVEIGMNSKKTAKKSSADPFFPIILLEPGSYVLVSNLDVSLDPLATADTDAIQIAADNVSLNMNGFSIIGPAICTGSPVDDCEPSGEVEAGTGIDACAADVCAKNTTVMEGTVRGMPGRGVRLGDGARVERVRAEENGEGGIETGESSAVSDSQALRNDDFGITAGDSSRLIHNNATGNGGPGISTGENCVVVGNVLTGNVTGLFISNNSGYLENILTDNDTNVSSQGVGDPEQLGKNLCGNDTGCP